MGAPSQNGLERYAAAYVAVGMISLPRRGFNGFAMREEETRRRESVHRLEDYRITRIRTGGAQSEEDNN
jgi:hypothetical protein